MDPTELYFVILLYVIYIFTVKIQHMIKHLNANLPKNGRKKKNLRGHVNDGHFSRWPWIWSIYLWYSRQQWQQWLDMSWTFLLVRIDILTSLMPVIGHCASLQCFHCSIYNLSMPYRHHVIPHGSVRAWIGRMGYSLSVGLDLNSIG